jgi:hypothetical protein
MSAGSDLSGAEAAKLSRSMMQQEREEAIHASPNVVGYERFQQTAKQVALRVAYRNMKPPSDDGPKAG